MTTIRMRWFPALTLAGAVAACAGDDRSTLPSPAPVQVGQNSYYVQGVAGLGSRANRNFISNAGFVITSEGVVVFDALGSPPIARELIAQIRMLTPLSIKRVVVSHYHADHIYGLQEFKAVGAEIWAHRGALEYLNSEAAQLRLRATRDELAPHVDANTRLVEADRWLEKNEAFTLGGIRFLVMYAGPAHSPEDLMLYVENDSVLFAGDIVYRGRIPFVGNSDSGAWLRSLDRLIALAPRVMVPGHGRTSTEPLKDLSATRDYLTYLRDTMGRAAQQLEPFDEAYRTIDWSRFQRMPLFDVANRMNAYNTYLLMEREMLRQ